MWKQHRAPVCQRLPAGPIDDQVVRLFFEAFAPAERDVYDRVRSALSEAQEPIGRARRQQLERLRYQARLAERQYQKADPDNRLVTAELEKRWETALQDLKHAEEDWQRLTAQPAKSIAIDPELRAAFTDAARGIPELWQQGL